ncbi:MAG: sigma-70 family RNA polymerase sigma factor [Polyangiaceae bacterium]|nr:sigma-70 family RNA polymerase sigma factor [Polyangiaceae bacterium]
MQVGFADPSALGGLESAESVSSEASANSALGQSESPRDVERLSQLVQANFGFVWRSLRRFGLSEADADDAAQQVFLVCRRRLHDIEPGRESAFLFGTARRVASKVRRGRSRRREVDLSAAAAEPSALPSPEDLSDVVRARGVLDQILNHMKPGLRDVFVLFEVEQLTMKEIAGVLELAPGTVASRLRRAREIFQNEVERFRRSGGSQT